jgi:predicted metal-binding membrane protein
MLRRDRLVVAGGLVVVIALAWVHLWLMAAGMRPPGTEHGSMGGMDMAMPATAPMGIPGVASLFAMWAVMMAAMMLPSAAPMTLLFASIQRRRRESASPAVSTGVFVAGYLLVWTAFSVVAAMAQVLLHDAALLSPMMASTSTALGAGLLIVAGVYQWTPLKNLCLTRCRTPIGFLTSEWREGRSGAFVMGIRHGAYCLGCCWALMALLFVAGVMNLLWIAVLAALVLAEKALPAGNWIGRAAGVAFVAAGVWMLLR